MGVFSGEITRRLGFVLTYSRVSGAGKTGSPPSGLGCCDLLGGPWPSRRSPRPVPSSRVYFTAFVIRGNSELVSPSPVFRTPRQ